MFAFGGSVMRLPAGSLRINTLENSRSPPVPAVAVVAGGLLRRSALLTYDDRHGREADRLLSGARLMSAVALCASAQVRFYGKRWRDAFLMQLRTQAPHCRITRWS